MAQRTWAGTAVAAVAAAAVVAAVLWAVFGPAAGWMLGSDLSQLTATDRTDALTDARVLLAVVLGATIVLIVAAASVITLLGQASERATTRRIDHATANLASGHVIVRAGGVWALDRILHDSPRTRGRVLESLTLHLRDLHRDNETTTTDTTAGIGPACIPGDLSAVVSVLRQRGRAPRGRSDVLDLHGADLWGVDLDGTDLRGADLTGADLTQADLTGADLTGARLTGATLIGATLTRTHLRRADLTGADATEALFDTADVHEAVLTGTWLQGADLRTAVGLTADQLRRARTGPDTGLHPDLTRTTR